MCEQFSCKLLCKIPLDPKAQALMDQGKNVFEVEDKTQKLEKSEKPGDNENKNKDSPLVGAYIELEKSKKQPIQIL